MTSGTKNNSMTSFYPFQHYDVILPMTPYTLLHPDDVTILFLGYDVIIFYDVNPLRYCDVISALRPCWRTGVFLLLMYLSLEV